MDQNGNRVSEGLLNVTLNLKGGQSKDQVEIKVAEIQRLLWKLFGPTATMNVSLKEGESFSELDLDDLASRLNPGLNLKGL